ncbi:WxL domain-containing protein [Enterococcus faecalis]|uniref:WxL domain-containing protein n=1 Tax=Enterococcus faecalis TaxID=1351 RepID=UPI0012E1C276|nr:WxL domain-containing protein [Enterococcus faecalis]EHT2878800.1 WxL domain-containing protein [Enterococcus faecalis]MUO23060.1 WxL domain-containing protein [Enterococcus faecalis]
MKQIKFKQLATFGLCCSLLVNSLTGVTAVAETVTIESSPTKRTSASEDTAETANEQELDKQKELEKSYNKVENSVEDQDKSEKSEDNNKLFQDTKSSIIPDSKNLSGVNENSSIESKAILPKAFVWAATATTNRTSIRLGNVVDYRLKFENITTTDTTSDIVGPIVISTVLSEGMSKPTSVMIKVGPEEQNVYLGEGPGNANSGNEYFVWTPGTRRLTVFINRLHGRNSGQSGYIKTLYFQSTITNGFHGEQKSIVSTINFQGFGEVRRINTMQYLDQYVGNLALAGKLNIYNEHGQLTDEQMTVNINPILYKSTNNRVEGTPKRYPITMTNTEAGIYSFNTGNTQVGTSNGGSWLIYGNDLSIDFATNTTNRIEKIVLDPPKSTLPDSRIGIMESRPYASNTVTTSNYDISNYNFSKSSNTRWTVPNLLSNSGLSLNVIYSDQLVGTTGQFRTGNYNKVINYYIYYKKVSEHFVNSTGTKIPPPAGFLENKQTEIKNENYTFKQSGTLPGLYKGTDGKTYKFKGWYKGKTKPATLETSKTPSYKVTYDDNDDLNVVYEETEAYEFPALTYQFGFVDESGQRVDASTIGLTYDNWYGELLTDNVADWQTITLEKGQVAPTKNNLKEITYPAQALERVAGKTSQYSAANLTFTLPKYYEKISVYNKTGTFDSAYPFPNIQVSSGSSIGSNAAKNFELKEAGSQSFVLNQPTAAAPIDIQVPSYLREIVHNPASIPTEATYYTIDKPIYYYLTNRKVTENFVDASGAKITAPTGFKQGKQTVIDSDDFTYTQEGTLPYIYKINNKPYVLKGWYKGKEKPAKLNQITKEKPNISYPVSYDDQDDVTVVYDELKLAGNTIQFGFVNEQGNYIPPTSKFNVSTDIGEVTNATYTKLQTVNSTINGNYLSLTIPAYNPTGGIGQGTEYYGSRNSIVTIPNYYKPPTLTPPSNYAGAAYPTATGVVDYHDAATYAYLPSRLNLTPVSGSQTNYRLPQAIWTDEETKTAFSSLYKMNATSTSDTTMGLAEIYATGTVNYYLENRRVTENFVDDTGAKITPPADFTQGNKVIIDSDNFTYTSAKALPDTYTAGDKAYQFKGWYKGTDKTALKTTKTPSYAVTYDDKDDMTAVYEEIQNPITLPDRMYRVLFINETGGLTSANRYGFSGELVEIADGKVTPIGSVPTNDNSAVKEITVPGRIFDAESPIPLNYGVRNATFTLPKMYKNVTYQPGPNYTGTAFPIPETYRLSLRSGVKADIDTTGWRIGLDPTKDPQKFTMSGIYWSSMPANVMLATLLSATIIGKGIEPTIYTLDENARMYLYLENRRVTENFVDATGAKITPPTGFKQGNKVVIDSDDFTYTSAKALPDTYTAGGKSYQFKGWYKGTDKTALKTTKTPSYAVTYDDKDDMTAVYEEVQATAEMTVNRLLEVVPNEASMIWTVRLKNTSEVPLTNVKLAPTAKWAAGISAPTQLAVRIGNTPNKIIPVTAEQWQAGVNLDIEIPVNGEALVTVNTAKITGEPRQLLTAEMTASGNFFPVTASNFVRIQGEDQTIEPTPAEEGFISTPTFDFGKIMISGSTKQYSLKKAADYYGNGTRNPYLRIKKSQPNWQLTAQLSQLKASTDSLPTSTRLLLGNADVAAIENYNQVTELTNKVGITEPLALTSDGTSTPVILNNQFTGNDVYQLEFDFASVKLEVPANQGKINEKYQGTVTWNLVTGP